MECFRCKLGYELSNNRERCTIKIINNGTTTVIVESDKLNISIETILIIAGVIIFLILIIISICC